MILAPRRALVFLVTVLVPLACASDDDGRAPPAGGGGSSRAGSAGKPADLAGAGGWGGEGSGEGGGSAAEGGGESAGDANIGHLGGMGVSMAGAPPKVPAECDITASWGSTTPLGGVSTADADEQLLALTHDELTIVYTRDGVLMLADRASAEQDFGAAVTLTLPAGYTHRHGLALKPDGLGLIVVAEQGEGFAEVTRVARSGAFGAQADVTRFSGIAQNVMFTGGEVAGPVLSSDGGTFFFARLKGGSSNVHRATGSPELVMRDAPEDSVISGSVGAYKLTQSVSADGRTLFFFDEGEGYSAGLWSSSSGAPFVTRATFPGLESVFAPAGCARLYGTREVEASLDVVIETPE